MEHQPNQSPVRLQAYRPAGIINYDSRRAHYYQASFNLTFTVRSTLELYKQRRRSEEVNVKDMSEKEGDFVIRILIRMNVGTVRKTEDRH